MNGALGRWINTMAFFDPFRRADAAPARKLPAELEAIDAMLAREARRQPVPEGVIERVFNASVGGLPRRRARVYRLEPPRRASLWGRLAIAASIGLAFAVATSIVRPRPLLWPEVELVLLGDTQETQNEIDRLLRGYGESTLGPVEHLLLTRDMTFNDLANDLAMLAADLEM